MAGEDKDQPQLPGTTDPTAAAREAVKDAQASAAKDKGPRRAGRPAKSEKRVEQLEAEFGAIAMTLAGLGGALRSPALTADGIAVVEHAPDIAAALGALADKNPRVAKVLDSTVEGSAWFGVVIAVAPLALTIAGNHGVGGQAPAVLEDGPPAPMSSALSDLSDLTAGHVPDK